MRTLLLIAASIMVAGPALAKSWSVDCTAGACAAVDSEGNIAFIDLDKQTVVGVDKLTAEPASPLVISCGAKAIGEGCVVVDGNGKLWFGPVRPGTPYKLSESKLP